MQRKKDLEKQLNTAEATLKRILSITKDIKPQEHERTTEVIKAIVSIYFEAN